MPDWVVERLASRHDKASFDCGKPLLDGWLRRYAGQYESRDLARVYVAMRPGQARNFGYYAISTCQIGFASLPELNAKGLPRGIPIPAALIGRLAVDRTIQGAGLGGILLVEALRQVRSLADDIGIRAVVVDAIDEDAARFYTHQGFEPLLDDPSRLFIAMNAIRALFP